MNSKLYCSAALSFKSSFALFLPRLDGEWIFLALPHHSSSSSFWSDSSWFSIIVLCSFLIAYWYVMPLSHSLPLWCDRKRHSPLFAQWNVGGEGQLQQLPTNYFTWDGSLAGKTIEKFGNFFSLHISRLAATFDENELAISCFCSLRQIAVNANDRWQIQLPCESSHWDFCSFPPSLTYLHAW